MEFRYFECETHAILDALIWFLLCGMRTLRHVHCMHICGHPSPCIVLPLGDVCAPEKFQVPTANSRLLASCCRGTKFSWRTAATRHGLRSGVRCLWPVSQASRKPRGGIYGDRVTKNSVWAILCYGNTVALPQSCSLSEIGRA